MLLCCQVLHCVGGAQHVAVGHSGHSGHHQPDRDAAAHIPGLQGSSSGAVRERCWGGGGVGDSAI